MNAKDSANSESNKCFECGNLVEILVGPYDEFRAFVMEVDRENEQLIVALEICSGRPMRFSFSEVRRCCDGDQ